jgi:two-component system, LytTR family, sensor kinase
VSFGVWGLVSLTATIAIAEFYRSRGAPMEWRNTLGMECSQILPYALLTPFVFVMATRYSLQRKNWLRRVILYLAVGLLFTLIHDAIRGLTPYAYWDSKNRIFHSAFWNSDAHKFAINWEALESIFFSNIVDDVWSAYLPIILGAHMVSFYQRSRERERRAAQLEAQLAKANLQNLKAQLQPHFLFNTMHSISALMLSDVGAADKMMARLSDLLRMSLEEGSGQITTLSHELEFVTAYLDIEKIRLGDRLNVVLDFASDTLHAQVPHLLLQPLVENAVKHGVSRISSPGEIRVLTTRDDDRLHLMITDNGPGLGGSAMAGSAGGLGLRATQERLRTLYGSNQHLEIRSKAGAGVEVSVEIPFHAVMQEKEEVVGL